MVSLTSLFVGGVWPRCRTVAGTRPTLRALELVFALGIEQAFDATQPRPALLVLCVPRRFVLVFIFIVPSGVRNMVAARGRPHRRGRLCRRLFRGCRLPTDTLGAFMSKKSICTPVAEVCIVLDHLHHHLPAGWARRLSGLGLGRCPGSRAALGVTVLPGAEVAMLPQGVQVVHHGGDEDSTSGLIDFLALEHPETQAAETSVARG